jgi:DNA polymerase III subunit delta'
MAGLSSVLGQSRVVENLRAAARAGRLHHAYLFEGPEGLGKATTARALAMQLNCDRGSGCGECDPCRKIEGGTHPDVIWFDMSSKGLTERVRELVAAVGFRPHEGKARVVILDPADGLILRAEGAVGQAANALLKTLEEPPADTHFVLVTAEARRLPVTVLSRCQRLRFLPVEEAQIARWLTDEHGVDPQAALEAAQLAGGSPGRALAETQAGEEAERKKTLLVRLLDTLKKPTPTAMFETAAEVGADREEANEVCGLLWNALRDALLVREDLHHGRVAPARVELTQAMFADWPSASLFGALAVTQEARQVLHGNVAPQLVIEHLLLALAPALSAPRRAGGRA